MKDRCCLCLGSMGVRIRVPEPPEKIRGRVVPPVVCLRDLPSPHPHHMCEACELVMILRNIPDPVEASRRVREYVDCVRRAMGSRIMDVFRNTMGESL